MIENPLVGTLLSFVGFIAVASIILYIFREKKNSRLPPDVIYNYEGSVSNQSLDKQVNRNAFFHTKGNTYSGTTYGPGIDRRKSRKDSR